MCAALMYRLVWYYKIDSHGHKSLVKRQHSRLEEILARHVRARLLVAVPRQGSEREG